MENIIYQLSLKGGMKINSLSSLKYNIKSFQYYKIHKLVNSSGWWLNNTFSPEYSYWQCLKQGIGNDL